MRVPACVRGLTRGRSVEVLTPDFVERRDAVQSIIASDPEVFNHNTETVPRLYRRVRGPKSDYRWTLELLRTVRRGNPAIRTKSGLMLGLGETREELLETLVDLPPFAEAEHQAALGLDGRVLIAARVRSSSSVQR